MTNDEYIIYVADRLRDVELMLGMNSLNWKEAHQRLDHNLLSEINKLGCDVKKQVEDRAVAYENLENMCYNVTMRQKVLYGALVAAFTLIGFIGAGVYL